VPLSETLPPSVLLAHAGEFHIGDLLIAAPLVVLVVIGLAWFVRAAVTDADDSTQEASAEDPTSAGPTQRRDPTTRSDG